MFDDIMFFGIIGFIISLFISLLIWVRLKKHKMKKIINSTSPVITDILKYKLKQSLQNHSNYEILNDRQLDVLINDLVYGTIRVDECDYDGRNYFYIKPTDPRLRRFIFLDEYGTIDYAGQIDKEVKELLYKIRDIQSIENQLLGYE